MSGAGGTRWPAQVLLAGVQLCRTPSGMLPTISPGSGVYPGQPCAFPGDRAPCPNPEEQLTQEAQSAA